DALTARGTVRNPDARPQQPHVVVDLGDGSDGRTRVAIRGLLIDRHGGAEPLDEVDIGPVHLPEKLPSVGRERFDVASLALGEDRVKREARLSRPRKPGEDNERVTGNLEIDVLQIV